MNRRTFASQVLGAAGALAAGKVVAAIPSSPARPLRVYFGTYTGFHGFSRGIYVADFDSATGVLGVPRLAARMRSPSYLEVHPSGRYVYAASESRNEVSAFAVCQDGTLRLINTVPAGGDGPCHVSIDKTGRVAVVSNYGGGSVASFQIKRDGSLSGAASFIQHTGSSVNKERQEGPHAHSAYFSPDNRFVLVCDLGLDKVFTYRVDLHTGKLTAHGFALLPPGSGPRHLAFSKSGRHVLVNNEMLLTETAFAYTPETGRLKALKTQSVLPKGVPFSSEYSTAETCVHPNGKWVYVSVRTHNSIARFRLDDSTGGLVHLGNTPSGGRIPRDFNIDPTGRWLLAAHQDSHHVVVFEINPATGDLKPTGGQRRVGGAVCVKFAHV